jgi:hypothetical protein
VLVLWLAHTEYAIISGLVSPPSLSTAGVQADMAAHGMLVSASRELAVLVDVFDPLTLTMSAFTSIALAVLWAVPLAAVRVRRLRHPAEPGLQLRFILIGGLVAGVLSAALIAAEVWLTNEHALPMELSWLLFAVGPAALGLMVLRRAGWLGPLQGLCAAQVAGLVALAILVELASAAHLTVPQQSWLSMFNGGTIVAGLLIVGVAQLSTRLATLAHSQAGLASPVQR